METIVQLCAVGAFIWIAICIGMARLSGYYSIGERRANFEQWMEDQREGRTVR